MRVARAFAALCWMLSAIAGAHTDLRTGSRDPMVAAPGDKVYLPWRTFFHLPAGDCVEISAQELGNDIRVRLEGDGLALAGEDGEISRFGRNWLVHCSTETRDLTVSVEAVDRVERAVCLCLAHRVEATAAFAAASRAFEIAAQEHAGNQLAADTFQQSVRAFESIGDEERATMSALVAMRHAQTAQDHLTASLAFDTLMRLTERLGWVRVRAVAMNDHALFTVSQNPARARQLIESAFAEQAALHDARLTDALSNNRCLIAHQFGNLTQARSCFETILGRLAGATDSAALATRGAVRNNIALVQLTEGAYAAARDQFRLSAKERGQGGDERGRLLSLGNMALCSYHLGDVREALAILEQTFEEARQRHDRIATAKLAEWLASIYLVWGDAGTARAYASGAEAFYRANALLADLSTALRLRAQIEADNGELARALVDIREAWTTALHLEQMQAASNISSVYARILLESRDLEGASEFIRQARSAIGERTAKSNVLSLDAVEVSLMRQSGRSADARAAAHRLLQELPFPGLLRTRVLVEEFLLSDASDLAATSARYDKLVASIRRGYASVPDPDFAFRLAELLRPAAERLIELTLDRCSARETCTARAAQIALRYASEPELHARPVGQNAELSGLLQALSSLQSRGDLSHAPEELRDRIRQLQAVARRQNVGVPEDSCVLCASASRGDIDLIYFFGNTAGYRWQRQAKGWRVDTSLSVRDVMAGIREMSANDTRVHGVSELSPLVAGLSNSLPERVRISGDARLVQIPFAALRPLDGSSMIDTHAVVVSLPGKPLSDRRADVAFFGNEGDGATRLESVQDEQQVVAGWAQSSGRILRNFDTSDQGPPFLLHVAAHGQRDAADGTSVLWLSQHHPLLSYAVSGVPAAAAVVINSCESGATSDTDVAQASIAAAFRRAGAHQVVATLFPISDRSALDFAKTFYGRLHGDGDNFAEALRSAQIALRGGRRDPYEWAAYVLTESIN